MILTQDQLNEICQQLVIDCPMLDDWLLWKYLIDYLQVENIDSNQILIQRDLTESEKYMLDKLYKKQQDRKALPKFLFDKLYNKPIPDEVWITIGEINDYIIRRNETSN